ncbi:MAG: amino acid adenylation domain-containing protein [Polyangiales bacterium]
MTTPSKRTSVDLRSRTPLVLDRISAHATSAGAHTAVVSGSSTMTYRELWRAAGAIAHALLERGVLPSEVVAFYTDRNADMVCAPVGILRAGAAYLAIDSTQPVSRTAFMIGDCDVRFVITRRKHADVFVGTNATLIFLDEVGDGVAADRQPSSIEASSRSYVVYSSGSTGEPKAAALNHGGLAAILQAQSTVVGLGRDTTMVHVNPIGFDIGSSEIFLTLWVGGTLVIAETLDAADPERLAEIIEKNSVNAMITVPARWQMLLDIGWRARNDFRGVTGGDAITLALSRGVVERGVRLFNCYGPSETTYVATACELRANDTEISLGEPLEGVTIHVLDEAKRVVGLEVVGELYIGGVGVGDGYIGRPELTEEKFLSLDVGDGIRRRVYRTGDLVEQKSNGDLVFHGRIDHQVKVNGFRVELGEIENCLLKHEDVAQVVAHPISISDTEKRIVAFVVPKRQIESATLRAFLETTLPAHMVPSNFVFLEALPLNANGKIDRKSLPDVRGQRPDLGTPYSAPISEREHAVAKLWTSLLQLDRVGADDNFFELGGTSIAALKLAQAASKEFGVHVSVATVFGNPTVRRFARALDALHSGPAPLKSPTKHGATKIENAPIAIIGMAGRFPGANDLESLWALLVEGKVAINDFTNDVDPSVSPSVQSDTRYVAKRGLVDGADEFDHRFFNRQSERSGYYRPAATFVVDPCDKALQDASIAPSSLAKK